MSLYTLFFKEVDEDNGCETLVFEGVFDSQHAAVAHINLLIRKNGERNKENYEKYCVASSPELLLALWKKRELELERDAADESKPRKSLWSKAALDEVKKRIEKQDFPEILSYEQYIRGRKLSKEDFFYKEGLLNGKPFDGVCLNSEEVEKIRDLLLEISSQWYNDPNGGHGYECHVCGADSTDGESSPVHEENCVAMHFLERLR